MVSVGTLAHGEVFMLIIPRKSLVLHARRRQRAGLSTSPLRLWVLSWKLAVSHPGAPHPHPMTPSGLQVGQGREPHALGPWA